MGAISTLDEARDYAVEAAREVLEIDKKLAEYHELTTRKDVLIETVNWVLTHPLLVNGGVTLEQVLETAREKAGGGTSEPEKKAEDKPAPKTRRTRKAAAPKPGTVDEPAVEPEPEPQVAAVEVEPTQGDDYDGDSEWAAAEPTQGLDPFASGYSGPASQIPAPGVQLDPFAPPAPSAPATGGEVYDPFSSNAPGLGSSHD